MFLDSLKSKHTKDQYLIHWNKFERSKYFSSEKDIQLIEDSIIEYLKQMENEGLSHSYRNIAFSAIKHHYIKTQRRLVLNWKFISKFMGEKTLDNKLRGYTTEEIQRLLNVTDVKYRAIILLLASTGMRREALTEITEDNIEYIKKHKLYKIRIYINTKDEQICYCTPEAAEALHLYLQMKKDDGHKELFWFKTVKNLTMILRQISIRAGVSEQHHKITENKGEKIGQYRHTIPIIHGFRHFCISQMKNANVDTEAAKILTGHTIGVRKRYLDGEYSDDKLLAEYLKAVNNLTIKDENRLKTKVEELEVKNKEIETLKQQMQDMQKEFHEYLDSEEDYRQNVEGKS